MIVPLSCPQCGAPLPALRPGDVQIQCAFCSTVCLVGAAGSASAAPTDRPPVDPSRRQALQKQCVDALKQASELGHGFEATLERVGREQLGPLGETQAFRNVVANLVYDFEAKEQVRLRQDAVAVSRIVEATFKAFEEIGQRGAAEINLPFLTANDQGPKHLQIDVSAQAFQDLAAREPVPPESRRKKAPPPSEPSPAPPPGEAPPPAGKGFFARLFGR